MKLAELFPIDWLARFGHGPVGMGHDVATTTKEQSNPSALAVIEKVGLNYIARLIMTWKTSDDRVSKAILRFAVEGLIRADKRPRKLTVDNSNEKFFASQVQRELAGLVPVDLLGGGETIKYLGEEMTVKNYLGNLVINTMTDHRLALANDPVLKVDFRLVKRDRGSFVTEVGPGGRHGDTFDAVKLALHSLISSSGPADATAMSVGSQRAADRVDWIGEKAQWTPALHA
jgi:hypothetical protein